MLFFFSFQVYISILILSHKISWIYLTITLATGKEAAIFSTLSQNKLWGWFKLEYPVYYLASSSTFFTLYKWNVSISLPPEFFFSFSFLNKHLTVNRWLVGWLVELGWRCKYSYIANITFVHSVMQIIGPYCVDQ